MTLEQLRDEMVMFAEAHALTNADMRRAVVDRLAMGANPMEPWRRDFEGASFMYTVTRDKGVEARMLSVAPPDSPLVETARAAFFPDGAPEELETRDGSPRKFFSLRRLT